MSSVNFSIIKPEVSHAEFIQLMVEQFPAVAEDALDEEWTDLIHLQVGCLARYANECVSTNDLPEFNRILQFVDHLLPKVDSALDNALYVSFIENLHLDGSLPTRRAARALLPAHFREFYVGIQQFWGISPDID